MSKLDGLTVVLIAVPGEDLAYGRATDAVMESFMRLKENGADMRIFSVGTKLVELMHVPETFAWMGHVEAVQMSSAVNRVNILRPRRIVVVAPEIIESRVGRPREGTHGYVWSPTPPAYQGDWRILQCEPAAIPNQIAALERPTAPTTEARH